MAKRSSTPRILLGLTTVGCLVLAGEARAACDANGNPSPAGTNCFHLKGSDTLFEIMTQAISGARAASVAGSTDLFYEGTGSGNGEAQMTFASQTGSPLTNNLSVQSIAPMSRNFRPQFIDPAFTSQFVQRSTTAPNATGHAAWQPASKNVLGLDAAVFVVNGATLCNNVTFSTLIDSQITGFESVERGVINKGIRGDTSTNSATNLPLAFGNGSAFNNLNSTVNYNNLLMVVLGGVDGSGSLQACSDPRRVQAVRDLTNCLNTVSSISHFYRRDDNSGTTDTVKDRIIVTQNTSATETRYVFQGGRFCNGKAIGGIDGSLVQQGVCSNDGTTVCTSNAQCGAAPNVCLYNLNNQDFDPIRRPCEGTGGGKRPTSCTDQVTGLTCKASDNNPNCNQGLVVALSDNDVGQGSVTESIRQRVADDATNVGYAGREAASSTLNTKALRVNTVSPTDDNVRAGSYVLARRLFLNSGQNRGTDPFDAPTDTATRLGLTGGGSAQLTAENALFGWATTHTNIDPIVKANNFITCCANPADDASSCTTSSGTPGLCAAGNYSPVLGALSALVPNLSVGGSAGTGGAAALTSSGGVSCTTSTGTGACITGNSSCGTPPSSCTGFTRPAANWSCVQNSDCASGLACTDALALNLGSKSGLVCQ